MRENLDDRVKDRFLWKNGILLVKLDYDEGVEDYDRAKSVKTMSSHFRSYFLSHSKRLKNDAIEQIGGFYNINIYYTDTDYLYIHKKYWISLVDIGFVGESLGLG